MGLVQPSAGRDPAASCVVHSSLRGLMSAVATPLVLLALGTGATISSSEVRGVPIALIAVGTVLGVIVAFDYPRHTRFEEGGISRVCILRTQRLPWSDVIAIERTPRRTLARVRQLTSRDRQEHNSGGLVARGSGRSRWLLTDHAESAQEHDQVRKLLDHLDVATTLRARRPPEGRAPSDLYRLRRRR